MSPPEDEVRPTSATTRSDEETASNSQASTREQRAKESSGQEGPDRGTQQTTPDNEAAHTSEKDLESAPRYWVGIGSSAGGLEALRALIGALESADRLCLIIVQHLAPQHRSRMAEIIAQDTPLDVREITDGEQPQAGTIYVTPPNADVVLENGRFVLQHPEQKIGPRPSVDVFFRSLAAGVGESAVGVILSGTGSDGAKGILAIKEEGGLTFCQKLDTAKYDGMPRAARQTGAVDRELTPEEIAKHLSRLNDLGERNERLEGDGGGRVGDPFQAVLSLLEERSKVDFGEYKPSTLRRRIERRMAATRADSLWDYAQQLEDDPQEIHALFQDVLISVTSFFRDQEPFDGLREALRARVAQKRSGETLRCWVAGCATGEEAYSIALLANEIMEELRRPLTLQVFATDIDERALGIARRGVYSHVAIEGLPAELRARYFVEHDDGVRVREHIREQIVFARHDVGRDPPFLKLDLISCRNVMIYFGNRLQARVLRVFHFALEDRGLLFLGKSETTSASPEHFDVVDKSHRVFSRSGRRGHLPSNFAREPNREDRSARQRSRPARDEDNGMFHAMVRAFAPDAILVDAENRVRHLYGCASQYLKFPQGEPNLTLAKLVPAEVSIDLGALLHRASRSGSPAHGEQKHPFEAAEEPQSVSFSVFPLPVEGRREYVVALRFRPRETLPKDGADTRADHEKPVPEHLEHELKAVREHLQGIVEEHETATEEMQALNEELQSSNEELQSTNEELETTNEELQSANEELTTLNEELSVKSAELQSLNLRHLAIQGAISYPLLVVDASLRIVDFNPAAKALFRLRESDRGHSLGGLDGGLNMRAVTGLATRTLETGEASHLQLRAGERDFEVQVQFYEGSPEGAGGCVVSFLENTELVRALEQVRSSGAQLSAILENTPAMVSMKDPLGTYTFVNRRFCERVGRPREEILGLTDEQLFGPEAGGALRERDFEVLRTREPARDEQALQVGGEMRWWLTSRFPLLDAKRSAVSVCAISLDITERFQRERQLQSFKSLVAGANAGVATFERTQGEDRLLFLSPELEAGLGYGPKQSKGQSLLEVLERLLQGSGLNTASVAAQMRGAPETVFTFERAGEHGHSPSWYELRCAHNAKEIGGQGQLLWLLFDVSDRVQAERLIRSQQDELAHFSRLAALGELTAGIAHEVNTPLTVITTKVDLLRALASRGSLETSHVLKVAEDVAKMAQTVSEVITGMRKMTGEEEGAQIQDLRTLVSEVAQTVGFRARQVGARLSLELAEDPVYVRCLPVQLMQVCTNLITNAADAVAELDERWIRLEVYAKDGWARMRVTDSGNGIDPALAERIMTPFFTTKKPLKGTGLGLSISRKFAQQHGGDLRICMDVPNTSFELVLPLAEKSTKGEEA